VREKIGEAAEYIRGKLSLPFAPKVGLILGTGMGLLAEKMNVSVRIPFNEIPHFPQATPNSPSPELVLGRLAGKPVVASTARLHCYEGYTMHEISFPVRVARALGIELLVLTNAGGGLNPQFRAGDLMVITDHINLMGDNPLIGPNEDSLGPRFPDMSEPYSAELVEMAEAAALELKLKLQRGVYLACMGPCLETRAEYRFMRMIGADAVGMSTVPEVIAAVHAGLKVLAFSAITDECFPDALAPADVPKIIATAKAIEPKLAQIVMAVIERLEV
jgi:purine-nucleoside phosphorylase